MRPASSTRARPTVLIAVAVALFAARLAAGVNEALHPPKPGGLVSWRPLDGAAAAAATAKKPILYDFSASWCEPCRKMEREVLANPEDAAFINSSYVPVRLSDGDKSDAVDKLVTQHEITGLPTLLVVYPKGEPRRLEGYPGHRSTLQFLKRAVAPRPAANPDDDGMPRAPDKP
jgi:thiol:disulfide interchange protein